jgi:hypothetical protein
MLWEGNNMTSAELNKLLVNKFFNLQEKYIDEVSWQEGDETGSHVVYGDVLTPYLRDCIQKDCKQEIQRVCAFLESLLEIDDKYTNEVVYFSVLESLEHLFKGNVYLISYLGERCRMALNEIIRYGAGSQCNE